MAKHTWLVRPTEGKAAILERAYDFALAQGHAPARAEAFAGYFMEQVWQAGWGTHDCVIEGRLAGTSGRHGRWQIAHGKNAENYRACFRNHLPIMAQSIIELAWNRIRNDDLDFIRSLNVSHCVLPHVHLETFQEFKDAVTLSIKENANATH